MTSGLRNRRGSCRVEADTNSGMNALRYKLRRMLSFSRAASRRDRGRLLFVPPLLLAISLFALQKPAIGGLAEDTKLDAGIAAERYALPITPPLDQGDSDLCWVFAALSMLETNYMVRHPGSKIALSRGALQVELDRRSISASPSRRIRPSRGGRACRRSDRAHSTERSLRSKRFPRRGGFRPDFSSYRSQGRTL